ncbi:hypothetical protein ACRRTK_007613 [Alexandromys fortis]
MSLTPGERWPFLNSAYLARHQGLLLETPSSGIATVVLPILLFTWAVQVVTFS